MSKIFINHEEKLISAPVNVTREEILSNPEHKDLYENKNYSLQFNLL